MKVIFIDGYCKLCSGFVDWLMRRDKRKVFNFASLQGQTAAKLFMPPPDPQSLSTMIYWREGESWLQSDSILKILSDLGGIWILSKPLFWIPRNIRDLIYRSIAKNRYKLFGKRSTCRIPTNDERLRFLP